MNKRKNPAFTLILILVVLTNTNLPLTAQGPDYLFFHLDVADGLASNRVNDILQDHEGFWWIGTANGLQRFDGKEFKTYRNDPADPHSLLSDNIISLFEDRSNRLWVWTGRGLCRYDYSCNCFQPCPLKGGYGKILEDAWGVLWAFIDYSGLFRLDPGCGEWDQVPLPFPASDWALGTFSEDPLTGDIWMAHWRGITWLEHKSGKVYHSRTDPSKHPVFSHVKDAGFLFVDPQRNLWVSNWDAVNFQSKGLLSFNLGTRQVKLYPENFFCQEVCCDEEGNLWFGSGNSENTLLQFQPRTGQFYRLPYLPGSPFQWDTGNNKIAPSCSDREGNLWFATGEGIYVMNPLRKGAWPVRFLPPVAGGKPEELNETFTFLETCKGEIWVGTFFQGTHVFSQNLRYLRTIRFPATREEMDFNTIWGYYQDRCGDIWAAGQHGVFLHFNASGKLLEKGRPEAFRRNTVRAIAGDEEGNIWFGAGSLLCKRSPDGKISGICSIPVAATKILADGNFLWISNPWGLSRWDNSKGKLDEFDPPINEEIKQYYYWVRGFTVWDDSTFLVYGNKLLFFNKRTATYTEALRTHLLPSQWVNFAQKTGARAVWLGTEGGLARWDPQANEIRRFGIEDGVPCPGFFEWNSSLVLRDGRVLSETDKYGFFAFHPDSITDLSPPPDAMISGFEVSNRPLQGLDSLLNKNTPIKLTHRQNFIEIGFTAPAWLKRNQLTYRYRLREYDRSWIENHPQGFATYTGLPPGSYVFLVQAVSGDGIRSRRTTELTFRILPPWWATWWFRALAALSLIGLGRWFHLFRMRRREQIQRLKEEKKAALELERQRIARDMHDDLGSGLSALNLLAEVARQKSADKKVREEIGQISSQAQELSAKIREIIWTASPRNDSLESLLSYLHQHAVTFFEPTGIQLNAHWPEAIPSIKIPGESRRHLYLAFKEALNNIVKHACATKVGIEFNLEAGLLLVIIRDNGKGFDTALSLHAPGSGLKNMAERMQQVGGRFSIRSGSQGTELRLELGLDPGGFTH